MEWLNDLVRREGVLRRRIAEMMDSGSAASSACCERAGARSQVQERFRSCVEPEVKAIDALLEDYLCGRNEDERSRMRFEARLSLPIYSHLRNLFVAGSPRG